MKKSDRYSSTFQAMENKLALRLLISNAANKNQDQCIYTSTPANWNKWMPRRPVLMASDYKRLKGKGKGLRTLGRPSVLLPVAFRRQILSPYQPAAAILLECPLMRKRGQARNLSPRCPSWKSMYADSSTVYLLHNPSGSCIHVSRKILFRSSWRLVCRFPQPCS